MNYFLNHYLTFDKDYVRLIVTVPFAIVVYLILSYLFKISILSEIKIILNQIILKKSI